MYARWAKKSGLRVDILNWEGDLPRVTEMEVFVPCALLLGEKGVQRLTRISPFGNGAIQTSFARVEVAAIPSAKDAPKVTEADIDADYFCSGGNGGQNAQKNCTAVRLTHVPSGLKACCQSERSQWQNYQRAKAVLLARVAQAAEPVVIGEGRSTGWGESFRSYVLNGKARVKDRRSGFETANAKSVIDGNISEMLVAGSGLGGGKPESVVAR